jgi:glutathione synthase/RimK-type ligase-like ATP-grasp enzyme
MKVITWLWRQSSNPNQYDADKVNAWAAMVRRHLTLPHTLACVTDMPEGIGPSIEIIPLPKDFDHIKVSRWSERGGLPQCYRRLTMFAPDMQARFGTDRLISMDLDLVICANIDSLFQHKEPFKIFKGTSRDRPYNGSMQDIRAGVRPDLYERFNQEAAEEARTQYLGSDQGWIAFSCGWTLPTWGPEDGVYFYNAEFARKPRPQNMRILFFPGKQKPWERLHDAWYREHWAGHITKELGPGLYAYQGPKQWGERFQKAAKQLGHECKLFTMPEQVPPGARAWVRLDQQGQWRETTKSVVNRLHKRGVIVFPGPKETHWYDNKWAQLEILKPFLPETVVLTNQAAAIAYARSTRYPMVSKSSEGASSANVRLLHSEADALKEIRQVFGEGLRISHGRIQSGYVYYQRFVPGLDKDYRIIVAGDMVFGLERRTRPGDFRASGSGVFKPIFMTTEHEKRAAKYAVNIANSIKTKWCAFDIVFDQTDKAFVLEISSSWLAEAYKNCPMFNRNLKPVTGGYMVEAVRLLLEAEW